MRKAYPNSIGRYGAATACLLLLLSKSVFSQEAFTVHVTQATGFGQVPALHSGAHAVYQGKWIFIGGRTNGLHGFYPPMAFPSSGINSTVFVYDPLTDLVQSASLNGLPDSLEDPLCSSNMQFIQKDSVLVMCGGYGWSQDAQDFITYPRLTSVDLNLLIAEVQSGSLSAAPFHMLYDERMAVCGAEMDRINNQLFLVFGHRFDGIYNRTNATGFFEQHYTNQVRKFELGNNWLNPLIQNYSVFEDTLEFHRRDFNLVPQVFQNGDYGFTAFSGVFLPGINLPFHNGVDVYNDSARVNTQLYQQLNAYSTAHVAVWDSSSNAMHTLFMGGMARYYPNSNGQVTEDTLVPFVKTISRMSRWANGTWSEVWMPDSMPFYQGTNARFIPAASTPLRHEKIVFLNNLGQQTLIGYLVGGMSSPEKNISETDPSSSFATPEVMEVWLEKTITDTWKPLHGQALYSAYPNPCKDVLTLTSASGQFERGTALRILSRTGSLVRDASTLLTQIHGTIAISTGDLKPGLYYLEIKYARETRTCPFVVIR